MFPRRSDFTSETEGSAWFFLAGASAYAFDHSTEANPLIIQTRMGDIIYRLQERVEPLRRPELRPEWQRMGQRVADAAASLLRTHGINPAPVMAASSSGRWDQDAVRQLIWLAIATAGSPADVTVSRDAILPNWNENVLRTTPPTYLFAAAPYRATWLRTIYDAEIEPAGLGRGAEYRPLTGETASTPSLLSLVAVVAIVSTVFDE